MLWNVSASQLSGRYHMSDSHSSNPLCVRLRGQRRLDLYPEARAMHSAYETAARQHVETSAGRVNEEKHGGPT